MADIVEALGKIEDFTKSQTEEMDKLGYTPFYDKITDLTFNYLNGIYTIENLEYHDSYFLFGMGTHSILNFKIKEIPDFTFGIWYYPQTNNNGEPLNNGVITISFFTQYTDNIDKFKPSHSSLRVQGEVNYNQKYSGFEPYITKTLVLLYYMHKYPILMAYSDMIYDNLEEDILPCDKKTFKKKLKTAKREMKRFHLERALKEKWTNKFDHKLLNYVKNKLHVQVYDKGESWLPRYRFILVKEEDDAIESGCYGFDEFVGSDAVQLKVEKMVKKFQLKMHKINRYYDAPFFYEIHIYSQKELEEKGIVCE